MRFPLLTIACKSLWNRRLTSALTISSIALSVALLLGVEKIRTGARESFTNTISQTDLIVGARGGTIQLLLYSVFHIGTATNNISWKTFETWKANPAVAWTIPISLGDSHRGYRVVATDKSFYAHYRFMGSEQVTFASGRQPEGVFDVAIGTEVAKTLSYGPGNPIVLSHGIGDGAGIVQHGDKPFTITGIISPTGTPIDRSVYITLEGMEAIHMDWTEGAPPPPGKGVKPDEIRARKLPIKQITAFLLRTKSRIETLRLQRDINTWDQEALTAIIPGVTLSELWSNIGYAETGLLAVSALVVFVGLIGMLVSLYSSLNERRREMAIFRAIGVHPSTVGLLLVAEAFMLSCIGALVGIGLTYGAVEATRPLIREYLGLALQLSAPSLVEWSYIVALLGFGLVVGLLPARRAYKNSVVDGLTIRV